MRNPIQERTVVLIKPDGVMRGLIGEIISRFEKRGLKIVAMKMVWPTRGHIDKHYPESREWLNNVGSRTLTFFKEHNIDAKKHLGSGEATQIGKMIKGWLGDYLTKGPVVAMAIEGMHAISVVRKLVGSTYPTEAMPGTIRGDFSIDTPASANVQKRVVKNVVHASGDSKEAMNEIEHWFFPEEIHTYKRSDEEVMF